jgi:hypothetical protein
LNAPLCTFSTIDDLNAMTLTPDSQNLILTDVNGQHCLARFKSQYWVYFKICCKPALGFGAQGDHIQTDLDMIIENNGSCMVDPVRDDQTPEVIPQGVSSPCLSDPRPRREGGPPPSRRRSARKDTSGVLRVARVARPQQRGHLVDAERVVDGVPGGTR